MLSKIFLSLSMSQKGTISEKKVECSYFEWQIPVNDLSVTSGPDGFFSCSSFTFSSCTWKLTIYPHGYYKDGWMSVYLAKDPSDSVPSKTVAFSIGVKKSDGTKEETEPLYHTFDKNDLTCGWSNLWNLEDVLKRKAEMTMSGSMTILCRIANDVPQPTLKVIPKSMKLLELGTLSTDFKDLFINKTNCDASLKVKGEVFNVHRAILMARSPVFSAMFQHKTSEKETGIVTIDDCDPDSFGDFLQYIYTGEIEGISFRNAYHLYVTADKYQVKELKSFCVSYMMRNLNVENVCDVVSLAEQYDDSELMSSGQRFFDLYFGEICSTSEWKRLLRNNYLLSYRLLEEMASPKKDLKK